MTERFKDETQRLREENEKTRIENMMLAMELGHRFAKRGMNIQRAREEFMKIVTPKEDKL